MWEEGRIKGVWLGESRLWGEREGKERREERGKKERGKRKKKGGRVGGESEG